VINGRNHSTDFFGTLLGTHSTTVRHPRRVRSR